MDSMGNFRRQPKLLLLVIVSVTAYILATLFRTPIMSDGAVQKISTVVISAPIQTIMYAGDRYLAANLEAIRVAAIGPTEEESLANYRKRAYQLVSQLNACHADNYYQANAILSWGGAVKEGNDILQRATECRYWDDIPPFFLGFNRYFFFRDIEGAIMAINTAAERSQDSQTELRKLSIVMATKKINDLKMAVAYLKKQRDEAQDKKLVEMLDHRLQRLEGLIALRNAQTRFEAEYGRPLAHPDELITSKVLADIPKDPMRIGYEFANGIFRLKAMRIGGIEVR